MAVARHLARPPIKEALVDIRIASASPIDAERLAPLKDRLSDRLTVAERINKFSATLRVVKGAPQAGGSEVAFQGLMLKSADGTRVAQFRTDGFTLNRLPPYVSADELLEEAMFSWGAYRDCVEPTSITRIALRYINRLVLPMAEGDNFARFLTAVPPTPPGIEPRISSFLSRLVVHDVQSNAKAALTLTLESAAEPDEASVILDIDVFREVSFEPVTDDLMKTLVQLRDLKNRLFFSSITEETASLYS